MVVQEVVADMLKYKLPFSVKTNPDGRVIIETSYHQIPAQHRGPFFRKYCRYFNGAGNGIMRAEFAS